MNLFALPARVAWKKNPLHILTSYREKRRTIIQCVVVPKGRKMNLDFFFKKTSLYIFFKNGKKKMLLRLPSRMNDSKIRDVGALRGNNYYEFTRVVMILWRWYDTN